jgi:hypothetical protein
MPILRPPKPATHNADLTNLPIALHSRTQERRWGVWSWRWTGKKWDKPPLQACNPGRFAKSDDPTTWANYTDATAVVAAGRADGIGYMLADSDLNAVDLDHCRDPQTSEIDAWAQTEIDAANSYVEVTVSGTGLRILGIGSGGELHRKFKIPGTTNGAAIEVYRATNRYITITGAEISVGAELIDIDAVLDRIVERYTAPNTSISAKNSTNMSIGADLRTHSADIDDLIRNGAPHGRRSEAFAKVVWALAAHGHSLEAIRQTLAANPNGIAGKYIDRLDREAERCYRKWLIANVRRPAKEGEQPIWPDLKDGEPKRTYRNAREAIVALGITCSYDEFHDRSLVGGELINECAGELSDQANVVLRQMIVERFDFDPGKDNVADATAGLCFENRFDPVRDYLDSLDWDGVLRLETWQTTYLGAEDTPLNRATGRLTMTAAVRRARKPGCKFDQIPVWEGPEGTNKSTAIAILAGQENFSDQTILTERDKEQQELLRGVWIYEIADLAGMKRSEVEKVKAFASRTHDRARPAYGRRRVDAPRRGIIIGTTNDDEYLKSETGNRRFWPLKTGTIDIDALRRDRDQLWAEAAAVEEQGGSLVLPKELWAEAAAIQDERRQHDPWDDILADVKGELYPNEAGGDEERVRSDAVLKTYLEISPGKATNADTIRLKRSMQRLGWSGPKKMRFGGDTPKRGYFRKVLESAGTAGTAGTAVHTGGE